MISSTVTVRMVWPFTRVLRSYRGELEVLRNAGIGAELVANPETRIPHAMAWKLITISLERSGNPALGLLAGQNVEDGDWGAIATASATCPDLRRALNYWNKYVTLVDDLADFVLIEQSEIAIWRLGYNIVKPLPALNDFIISSAIDGIARFVDLNDDSPIEVHVMHPEPDYASEYTRLFGVPIRFNAEYNAIVFPSHLLDRPLSRANPDLFLVFDQEVKKQFEGHVVSPSASVEVRRILTRHLGRKQIGINEVAKEVHMSAATLKRRLSIEGTTYSGVLDEVRRDLALRYLSDRRLSIAKVALRLGFSNASAFGRAFNRWLGVTPRDYRRRELSSSNNGLNEVSKASTADKE